jgi:hypothetical protein
VCAHTHTHTHNAQREREREGVGRGEVIRPLIFIYVFQNEESKLKEAF